MDQQPAVSEYQWERVRPPVPARQYDGVSISQTVSKKDQMPCMLISLTSALVEKLGWTALGQVELWTVFDKQRELRLLKLARMADTGDEDPDLYPLNKRVHDTRSVILKGLPWMQPVVVSKQTTGCHTAALAKGELILELPRIFYPPQKRAAEPEKKHDPDNGNDKGGDAPSTPAATPAPTTAQPKGPAFPPKRAVEPQAPPAVDQRMWGILKRTTFMRFDPKIQDGTNILFAGDKQTPMAATFIAPLTAAIAAQNSGRLLKTQEFIDELLRGGINKNQLTLATLPDVIAGINKNILGKVGMVMDIEGGYVFMTGAASAKVA